jgi:glycosyltransferase involved in cell wall biosynthesis
MPNQPLVSLLMPVWRPRADWLELAVASALGQDGVEIELVVVDDGNELSVVDQLRHVRDSRLRIERIEHSGHAGACNAAIELARGEYVRIVDADDAFPHRGTALLLALAAGRDDVLVYGGSLVCDEELRPLWRMKARQQGDVTRESLLARFNVRPGGLLWPRGLLRRTGWFDTELVLSGDWEYIQRAVELARVIGTVEIVHLYRRHGAAMTADIDTGRASAREIVRRYFQRHPEQRGTRLERQALAMLDATAARVYATHGQPRRAAVHLARGLARDPLCLSHEFAQARAVVIGGLDRRLRGRRESGVRHL